MNNVITLIGNAGRDAEVKELQSGKTVASFSLAVTEYGEDKPLWFEVEAWNGLSDAVSKTVSKGREVMVVGRLKMNSYEKNGKTITTPTVVLTGFHACGKK